MLKTNSMATVGNRNRYGANCEPQRDRLGGVSNDLASAGDIVSGALIGRYHLITPTLQYSKTPVFQDSNTPFLICSPPCFRDPAPWFRYHADRPQLVALTPYRLHKGSVH